jgi:ribulose-5-phosphate 4-epimerase/fuculose-1-phosphate aldolase
MLNMDKLERAKRDLVIANRILAMHDIVDAYGHVSIRHPDEPDKFMLSRSLAPELVTIDDITVVGLDGKVIDDERSAYAERYIHAAFFEARPEVNVVVHAHAEAILPFSITKVPLRAVINQASDIGSIVPVWDIAHQFGGSTNSMVTNMDQGRDLAKSLGSNSVVLLRGHGFGAAGNHLIPTINMCVVLPKNARVLLEAIRLGDVTPISDGEIETFGKINPNADNLKRGWNFWAIKAGVGAMLADG